MLIVKQFLWRHKIIKTSLDILINQTRSVEDTSDISLTSYDFLSSCVFLDLGRFNPEGPHDGGSVGEGNPHPTDDQRL